MDHILVVSETVYGLHSDYEHTVGEPLQVVENEYTEAGEVALYDEGHVVILPVMYTVPADELTADDYIKMGY